MSYKSWCTITCRYKQSPFISDRIMNFKAAAQTNSRDYSNASFWILRRHFGVARFLNELKWATFSLCSIPKLFFLTSFFVTFCVCVSLQAFCVKHIMREQITLWFLVIQFNGKWLCRRERQTHSLNLRTLWQNNTSLLAGIQWSDLFLMRNWLRELL